LGSRISPTRGRLGIGSVKVRMAQALSPARGMWLVMNDPLVKGRKRSELDG
jgi:hypothetical protein